MTFRILRVDGTLRVEISEVLVEQAGFRVGEPLEWVREENGDLTLVRPADATSHKKEL